RNLVKILCSRLFIGVDDSKMRLRFTVALTRGDAHVAAAIVSHRFLDDPTARPVSNRRKDCLCPKTPRSGAADRHTTAAPARTDRPAEQRQPADHAEP